MLMETFDRLSRKEKYVWDVSDLSQMLLHELNKVEQIIGHVRILLA
jgi:hypothetical protein